MAQKETHKWADFGLKKIYFVPWHLNNPCRQPDTTRTKDEVNKE
jgi:hypothetical protein